MKVILKPSLQAVCPFNLLPTEPVDRYCFM